MDERIVKDIIKRTLIQMKTIFVVLEHDEWGSRVLYTTKTREDCLMALNLTEEDFKNQYESANRWNSRELGPFEENSFHCYYSIEEYSLPKLFNELITSYTSIIDSYSKLLNKERARKGKIEEEIRIDVINEMIANLEKVRGK